MRLFPLFLVACTPLGTPSAPCASLCEASTERFTACLEARDESWENAGYGSASDYRESCHTWAWELQVLARATSEPAESEAALDAFCETQQSTIEAEDTDCDAFFALDWETEPWLR